MAGIFYFSEDEQGVRELGLSQPNKSAFGELAVYEKKFATGWNFFADLNTITVAQVAVGDGTITQGNAGATLSTGTAAGSSMAINTKRAVDYLNGTGVECLITGAFPNTTNDAKAELGVGDDQNGFFFSDIGGVFSVVRRRGGVDEIITQANWNKDTLDGTGASGMNLSKTDGNIYKIEYGWLGYRGPIFSVAKDDGSKNFVVVHEFASNNITPDTHILVPNLPVRAFVDNGTTTTDFELFTPSSGLYTQGAARDEGVRFGVFNSNNASVGESGLLQIRNKATFAGNPNYARIKVDVSGVSLDSGQPAIFFVKTGASVVGESYVDVDTANSRVEWSAAVGAVSGGRLLYPVPVSGRAQDNSRRPPIYLNPGETLELTVDPGNNSPVVGGLSWEELI